MAANEPVLLAITIDRETVIAGQPHGVGPAADTPQPQ